jgi:4-hydroxythreonine-4-phosphate dehydrogenase
MQRPIVITLGDPAGIGPEIIVKAFRDAPELTSGCCVVGDIATLRRAAQVVAGGSVPMPVAVVDTLQAALGCPPRCVPVWQLAFGDAPLVGFGQVSAQAGRMAGELANMPVRMMLANDELRVVLVSIHVALRAAIEAVTFDRVLESLRITHRSLQAVLGRAPRIGVAGLNPHAGEGGSVWA